MCNDVDGIHDGDEYEVAPSIKKSGKRETGMAYRRKMKRKHLEQVRKNTMYSHSGYLYRSKVAYVDWDYDDEDWYPSGKYVKYPRNSNNKQFWKGYSNRVIRRNGEAYRGNQYKKVYKYFRDLFYCW